MRDTEQLCEIVLSAPELDPAYGRIRLIRRAPILHEGCAMIRVVSFGCWLAVKVVGNVAQIGFPYSMVITQQA